MSSCEVVQTSAPVAPARPLRHRWLKIRLHVRICLRCGTGKVNAQSAGGWYATYHQPDGTSQIRRHVPACAVGPLTAKFLEKYADRIAVPF